MYENQSKSGRHQNVAQSTVFSMNKVRKESVLKSNLAQSGFLNTGSVMVTIEITETERAPTERYTVRSINPLPGGPRSNRT